MGVKNTVTSFNYDGTTTAPYGNLQNQDYNVCFKAEKGKLDPKYIIKQINPIQIKNVSTLCTSSEFIFQLGMCSMQYVENAAATDSFQLNDKAATKAKVRINDKKYH